MEITYSQFLHELNNLNESKNGIKNFLGVIHATLFSEVDYELFAKKIKSNTGVNKVVYNFLKFIRFSIDALISIIKKFFRVIGSVIKGFIKIQKKLFNYVSTGDQAITAYIRRILESFGLEIIFISLIVTYIRSISFLPITSYLSEAYSNIKDAILNADQVYEIAIQNINELYEKFTIFIIDSTTSGGHGMLDKIYSAMEYIASWEFIVWVCVVYVIIFILATKKIKKHKQEQHYKNLMKDYVYTLDDDEETFKFK